MDPVGVKRARSEKLAWVHKSDLYDVVPRSECFEETGRKPVDLKRVDTNKGDQNAPLYRSRLVLRDLKVRKKESEKISLKDLFSCTPPLEAWKTMLSLMVSLKTSKRGKPLKMAVFDISRA